VEGSEVLVQHQYAEFDDLDKSIVKSYIENPDHSHNEALVPTKLKGQSTSDVRLSAMDPDGSILVVDDEEAIRASLCQILQRENYHVEVAASAREALERIQASQHALLLTDVRMSGGSGLELVQTLKQISPKTISIVMTGYGTIEMAVDAMRVGAFDFITKPYEIERVLVAVKNAFECRRLQVENETLRKAVRRQYGQNNLLGSSPAILEVQRLIGKVANTDSTVLIMGESGSGKELVAGALHYQNLTRTGPFVPVNCGAIPENLLESELFGHERGAFTGAIAMRPGRFELAHKGTVFLDEIGELSPALQVKLLRVLQERAFERVGGTKTIHVDVRIIAATNRDLEQAVEDRRFREDLYYRLNVIPIVVPPLRARTEDVPLLAQHFLNRVNRDKGTTVAGVAPGVLEVFMRYRWPGNVRELENMIERLAVLKKSGIIETTDLPTRILSPKDTVLGEHDVVFPAEGIDLPGILDEFERQLMMKALDLSNGVKSRAAQLLGLNRTTLVEKMKKKAMMTQKSVEADRLSDH
jgi:DNA-binding NtrC family response regulator